MTLQMVMGGGLGLGMRASEAVEPGLEMSSIRTLMKLEKNNFKSFGQIIVLRKF